MIIIILSYALLAQKVKLDEKDTAQFLTELPGDTLDALEKVNNKFIRSMFLVSAAYTVFMSVQILTFIIYDINNLSTITALSAL